MSKYFPKSKSSGGKVKVGLGLCNYATKADSKNETGVMHQNLLKKVELVSLKSNLDKLDTNKLKNLPSGLSFLKRKLDKLHVDK